MVGEKPCRDFEELELQKAKSGYKLVKSLFGKYEEIPEEWGMLHLHNTNIKIIDGDRGNEYPQETDFLASGYCLFLSTKNVTKKGFKFNECSFITKEKDEKLRKGKLSRNDIIITTRGTIGNIAYFDESIQYDKIRINSGMVLLRNNDESIYQKFLYLFLRSNFIGKQFQSIQYGSAQPQLTIGTIKSLKIIIPPISEQQNIASILSNVDNLIEKYDEIIVQTKSLKQGLMQTLLTRGIGHKKFKKVYFGFGEVIEIPDEWILKKLSEVAKIERGKFTHRPRNDPRFYGGKYPFIQTGDVGSSTGRITTFSQTLNELGLSVSKLFPKNTIVITIAANIGSTAITTFPVCFPDSLIGISSDEVNLSYLEHFLRTKKEHLNNIATDSAQKNINLETLRPLLIPIPSKDEQNKITMVFENVDSKLFELESKKSHLESLKKGLMQKMLTGQIRVTV